MYDSTTTVAVGLDVHARSIRLAAVRADELLEERTLPYDEEMVERLLRRWPSVRCCYEAGPTSFGLYRYLVGRGIECAVVAPGLVPQRPGDRVKTDPRDARKLARLLAGGLLAPIHVPSPELEAARDLVRAREDARLDRMRDRHRLSKFCLRHGRLLPACPGRSSGASGSPSSGSSMPLSRSRSNLPARGRPRRRADRGGSSRRSARRPSRGPAGARCAAALPARDRHAQCARAVAEIGDFSRFKCAEEFMAFVGLVPSSTPPANSAAKGRSPRSATATCAGCWSSRPGTHVGGRRSATSSLAANAAKTGRGRALWRCQHASTNAGSGWPAAANHSRRSSSPAPASSPASSGRSRPSNHSEQSDPNQPLDLSSGCARPHGEPSRALCGTARR